MSAYRCATCEVGWDDGDGEACYSCGAPGEAGTTAGLYATLNDAVLRQSAQDLLAIPGGRL